MNIFKQVFLFASASVILASCGDSSTSIDGPPAMTEAQKNGEAIFKATCTACHQKDGKGKAGFAPSIHNIDFLSIADDETIKNFILHGRPGTAMMAFENMDNVANNIDDLVSYMRYWENDYELIKKVAVDKEWVAAGNAEEGHALFMQYCSYCHGATGNGYASGGAGTAIGNEGFLNQVSDDYIRQTLISGRAGTAMKSFDSQKGLANMSRTEMEDVISYMRSL